MVHWLFGKLGNRTNCYKQNDKQNNKQNNVQQEPRQEQVTEEVTKEKTSPKIILQVMEKRKVGRSKYLTTHSSSPKLIGPSSMLTPLLPPNQITTGNLDTETVIHVPTVSIQSDAGAM